MLFNRLHLSEHNFVKCSQKILEISIILFESFMKGMCLSELILGRINGHKTK